MAECLHTICFDEDDFTVSGLKPCPKGFLRFSESAFVRAKDIVGVFTYQSGRFHTIRIDLERHSEYLNIKCVEAVFPKLMAAILAALNAI